MNLDNLQNMAKFITFITKLFRLQTLLKFLVHVNNLDWSSVILINSTRSAIMHIVKSLYENTFLDLQPYNYQIKIYLYIYFWLQKLTRELV